MLNRENLKRKTDVELETEHLELLALRKENAALKLKLRDITSGKFEVFEYPSCDAAETHRKNCRCSSCVADGLVG
jgi:hypothetical protein